MLFSVQIIKILKVIFVKRRHFISGVGAATVAASVSATRPSYARDRIKWKMATTWPRNFPGLGRGAIYLAKLIEEMSAGRISIQVYGENELVKAVEVFDAVSKGEVQMGHGTAFYWQHKSNATQFFSAVPFGLTAQEMNAWLYHGDGMELWEELYAQYNVIPAATGNTGVQMGGWFNREIASISDLQGLKMRIPGLGGEVWKRAGGEPVMLAGGEIFPALEAGDIEAAEWVGPYNDMALGLHKAARYYYYPGWHEPGTTLECIINKQAFLSLPSDLQSIVKNAIRVANQDMLAEFTAKNNRALEQLVRLHHVELRRFPDEVLIRLRQLSDELVSEQVKDDPLGQKVRDSFTSFRLQVSQWHQVSELAYMKARNLT